ncbi:hypothetical protein GWK47_004823 [Chionoecetes opilio]|uniref:Uncharacterized protein n=1 Tax=Chionoecetes opilio TaxID=41210 RepID=A0A8J4YEF1_CHIOP|nr:hypothetical protein GWK47_004823 [Chionoecetes opilio]
MASPKTDAACLICRDTISFKNDEYSSVGRKGLTSINKFTHRHNELYPTNPIPIYKFDENGKQYVHTSCHKSHTDSRRYEQIGKRQHVDETGPTSHKLQCDTKKFSFHTDCYLCGMHVDQEKARKYPTNVEYEFSHVMLLTVSETTLKDVRTLRNSSGTLGLMQLHMDLHVLMIYQQRRPFTTADVSNSTCLHEILHLACYLQTRMEHHLGNEDVLLVPSMK